MRCRMCIWQKKLVWLNCAIGHHYYKKRYICYVKAIKKTGLIILCLQIALPSDLLHDIMHLPFLFSHFLHHNHHHESVDFLHFVADHYSDNHHEEDHDDHEDLPFHHHHDQLTAYQQPIIAFSEFKSYQFAPVLIENFTQKKFYQQEFYPSDCSSSIWRPPKFSV